MVSAACCCHPSMRLPSTLLNADTEPLHSRVRCACAACFCLIAVATAMLACAGAPAALVCVLGDAGRCNSEA
jgi:hypothetical protein